MSVSSPRVCAFDGILMLRPLDCYHKQLFHGKTHCKKTVMDRTLGRRTVEGMFRICGVLRHDGRPKTTENETVRHFSRNQTNSLDGPKAKASKRSYTCNIFGVLPSRSVNMSDFQASNTLDDRTAVFLAFTFYSVKRLVNLMKTELSAIDGFIVASS